MSFYEKYECPVCKRQFRDGDDIVTCHICGTPHHRKCYNSLGQCANSALHSSGYDFSLDSNSEADNNEDNFFVEAVKANAAEYSTPPQSAENEASPSPFGNAGFPMLQVIPPASAKYSNDTNTINGESVSDYATTIGTNADYFIPKFKKMEKNKRKISWNWSAFLFGSLYLLFRKMYKQGIAFFSLMLTLLYASTGILFAVAPKAVGIMNGLMESYSSGKSITPEQLQQVNAAGDFNKALIVSYAALACLVLLRVVCAMLANSFYNGTISNIIKRVKKQMAEGSTFVLQSPLGKENESYTQDDLRRIYLSKKGGITLTAPMIAICIMTFII